jgi:antitoxin (DNA-binding transcriptional repressor) of toxin-antitoxin stability system
MIPRTVDAAELHENLNAYLKRVAAGETLLIAVDGKIVARLMPEIDPAEAAYQRILSYRKDGWVGDVLSGADGTWEQGN